jgi:DNA repair exonuclease SbcCD nuclease subunit
MERGIRIEIHIADIHFGALDPEYQFKILNEQFLSVIEKIYFDTLFINGDLFHQKNMANSSVVMYAIKFIDECVRICKMKNATLVLLSGTESHDAGQLRLFYHLQADSSVDVRIVEHTGFIQIKGKKILCIPEEYNKGEDYYNQFFNSEYYDMAILHGVFRGSIYGSNEPDLNKSRPVFKMRDFQYCGGPIICGHVHTPGCFEQHVYYSGSPLRFSFGEEEDKGFIILLHNLDTREYYVNFQKIVSQRYDTINLDDMIDNDPKDVISYIKSLQDSGIDNIRVEFTKRVPDNITILKNYYRNNPSIKIKDDSLQEQRTQKALKESESKYDEYDYIFDKSMSEYDILTRYINQSKGYKFISSEELIQLLQEI